MKRILFILAIFSSGILFAQKEDEKKDTTRFKFGGVEFIIVDHDTMPAHPRDSEDPDEEWDEYDEDDLTYWSGFDIGINMLMNGNFEPSFDSEHLEIDPANSFSYSFNFLEKRIRIAKDYFGIVTGIGFTNSRYGFNNDRLRLMSDPDSTWGSIDSTIINGFTKNQLRVNYFNIPILFHVNTSKNPDRNFHFSFGAIGGVRIGSKVKYKYDVFGGENVDKVKGRYNLNAFSVAGTFRMGYRDFGLFANYNFLTLYEGGKSESAYPLTFGASFHF